MWFARSEPESKRKVRPSSCNSTKDEKETDVLDDDRVRGGRLLEQSVQLLSESLLRYARPKQGEQLREGKGGVSLGASQKAT